VLSELEGAELLSNLPLLDGLSPELRQLVCDSFVPTHFHFGETVFEAGDHADAYYVVTAGSARVLVVGDDGSEVSLNRLEPGDPFGEAALLEGTPRTATVRASSQLTVARLDGGVFRAVVDRHPEIRMAFAGAARARRINDFLRVHSAFAVLSVDATLDLIEHLQELELEDREEAVRQGEAGDAMFLVQAGRLGVWRTESDGELVRLRTLHSGDFFGELALLNGDLRSATVRAEGVVRLLRLDEQQFHRMMALYEPFARRIGERQALYESRDRRATATEATDRGQAVWDAADPGLAVTEAGPELRASPEAPPGRRRFPFFRQIDEMDCGAACISMVCRSFGHDVSMASIRSAVGTGTEGTSLRGLVRGGEELGLQMQAIKSSPDRLDALPLPAILHWEGRHWLVLYRVDAERVRVADPARGLRKLPRSEVDANWSGYAALAAPTERLAAAPRGGLDLRWMWPFVKPHSRRLTGALVLALIAAGLEMVLPVFAAVIIDRVLEHNDHGLLYVVVAVMLGVVALAVMVTIVQRLIVARVASRLDADSLDFVSGRLLRLPMRYFEARRTGDIQRRLIGMQQVRATLIQNGVAVVTAVTQLIVGVTIMFIYSWQLALVYVACAPLYGLLMLYSQRRMQPVFDSVEAGHGRYQSRQIDAIRGIATVKAMGAEELLRQRMWREFAQLRDKLLRADIAGMVYEGLVSTVTFLVYGLFLFFGALLVIDHQLTIGQFVAFNGLVLLANAPLMVVLTTWDRLQWVTVLMGRLQDVIENEPEQGEDHSSLKPVVSLEGHVRLRRVTFTYPSTPDTPIVSDVSLDVAPGQTVALVGRSGSGKSTLVKLIAGLLIPTAGSVEYDGDDILGLRLGELRRRIGFVLQEAYLFDDTIANNIGFGDSEPTREKVVRAAEIANAAEFIERLPLGYETRVGDSGLKLSGGQAQRVAIARALYHEPPVLIFDEATSALDTEAERAFKQNLDRVLEGRTGFVIAHRLSTIRDADMICVLEQGRLVEQGTHEQLLDRQGLYAYLLAQQLEA
jgi:ATP-binding cassette subfamily B protein